MSFITAITDVQDAAGQSVVVANPDGTRPQLALKLGSGLLASYTVVGVTGVVTVNGGAGGTASGVSLILLAGFAASSSMGGPPAGAAIVRPSTDFPGATTATFYGVVTTTPGSAPAWAATTAYSSTTSPPSIVVHNGVCYVCTTSGTSGSSGPSGFGAGITDGSCVWRSATASALLVDVTASDTVLATLTTTYTLTAGASLPSTIELTADVTAALIPLTSRHLLTVQLGGDIADTSNLTGAICLGARIIFA